MNSSFKDSFLIFVYSHLKNSNYKIVKIKDLFSKKMKYDINYLIGFISDKSNLSEIFGSQPFHLSFLKR